MTDILTTDRTITPSAAVAKPQRANQILTIAVAVSVAIAAVIVAINMTGGSQSTSVERATEAAQLRWEGLAATQTTAPAAQLASQLRWEGLAATSSVVNTPAAQLASQLRWEGLAATSSVVYTPAAQLASQLRWEGLATQAHASTDRGLAAQVARLQGLAGTYQAR